MKKSNEPTKTKSKMKKTIKYLSMAALAMVGAMTAGCTSDDNAIDMPQQPENQTNVVTLTTTVGFDEATGGTTRALDINYTDKKLTKTFAVGDQIAVVYENTGGTKVKAVTEALTAGNITAEGKSATFTVTLTDPKASGTVKYIYPAAMAGETDVDYTNLNAQDGTLATIASNYDLAVYDGSLTAEATLPASPTLTNGLAIIAYTIKDADGTNDLTSTMTGMTLSDGTNNYAVTRSAAAGPIYVAIQPTSGANIEYTATDGTKSYAKSVTSKTYAAGEFYQIGLRMATVVTDLSMVDNAGTARTQQWTANCYMVHTTGAYKLPLVYGNAIKDGAANATAYTGVSGQLETFPNHAGNAINAPWITKATTGEGVNKGMGITVASAELLWQDAVGLITEVGIDGDYLTLTVGKDAATQQGNALVAAKDGSGNIVWSWHIWVTKQTFAADDLTTVTTGTGTLGTDYQVYKVTPVNLGWVPTGGSGKQGYNTYYQWGRKDAFIPSTGSGSTNRTVYNISNETVTGLTYTASTTAAIADNIKNPTTHYYNSSTYGPCDTQYYNMWDAQQTGTDSITTATKKTVYDPCPAGFCVPTGNLYYFMGNGNKRTMSTWDSTNKGATWNNDVVANSITGNALFFPASGIRSNNSGALKFVGSYGYYWSASPRSSSNGRYLYFTSGYWYWSGGNRAFGSPVRAVAEE